MRVGLEGQILARIRTLARRRAYAWAGLGTASGLSLLYAIVYTNQAFSANGSYEYLSLFFSDAGSLVSNWYEFSLALAESLPITEITLSLLGFLALLWSVDKVIKNIWIQKEFQRSYFGA